VSPHTLIIIEALLDQPLSVPGHVASMLMRLLARLRRADILHGLSNT
jgi:hypothetical protein